MSIIWGERLLLPGSAPSGGELQDFKKHLSSTILSGQTANEIKRAALRSRDGNRGSWEKISKIKRWLPFVLEAWVAEIPSHSRNLWQKPDVANLIDFVQNLTFACRFSKLYNLLFLQKRKSYHEVTLLWAHIVKHTFCLLHRSKTSHYSRWKFDIRSKHKSDFERPRTCHFAGLNFD